MPQRNEFTEYALLADIETTDVQNLQDLAAIWGPIREECTDVGAEVSHRMRSSANTTSSSCWTHRPETSVSRPR